MDLESRKEVVVLGILAELKWGERIMLLCLHFDASIEFCLKAD